MRVKKIIYIVAVVVLLVLILTGVGIYLLVANMKKVSLSPGGNTLGSSKGVGEGAEPVAKLGCWWAAWKCRMSYWNNNCAGCCICGYGCGGEFGWPPEFCNELCRLCREEWE